MKLNSSSENQNQNDNDPNQQQNRQSYQKRRGPRYGTYNSHHNNQSYNNSTPNVIDEETQLQEKEKCLFVSFVNSSGVSHNQLSTFFSTFGKVKKVYIPKNQPNQAPRNFAFVTFETKEAAENVLDSCPASGFRIDDSVFFVAKNKKKTLTHSSSSIPQVEGETHNELVDSIETPTNSEANLNSSNPNRKKSKSVCIQPIRQPLTGAPTDVGFSTDYQKERKLKTVPTFPASASPGFAVPPKQEEKKEGKKKIPTNKKQGPGQQNQAANKNQQDFQPAVSNSKQENQTQTNNESGNNPPAIHSAIIQKKEQEVFLLLLQGQNPNVTDRQGQTALDLCNSFLSSSTLKEDVETYKRILVMLTTYEAKTKSDAAAVTSTSQTPKAKVSGPPTNYNAPVFVPGQQSQEKDGDIMKFFSNLSLEKPKQYPQQPHRQASQVPPDAGHHMKGSSSLFVPQQTSHQAAFAPYFQPQAQDFYSEGPSTFPTYPPYYEQQSYPYYDYSHSSSAPFIPQKQHHQQYSYGNAPSSGPPVAAHDSSFQYNPYLPSPQGHTHYQQQQQFSNYYFPNTASFHPAAPSSYSSVPGTQTSHSPQTIVKK